MSLDCLTKLNLDVDIYCYYFAKNNFLRGDHCFKLQGKKVYDKIG